MSANLNLQLNAAMDARPHLIDGKAVHASRAMPFEMCSEANVSTKRLRVCDVNEDDTAASFRDYFQRYGVVEQVEMMCDESAESRRAFVVVTFRDYDSVDKCVLESVHNAHVVNGKRCEVKKCPDEDEMRKMQSDRDRLDRESRSRGESFLLGPPDGSGDRDIYGGTRTGTVYGGIGYGSGGGAGGYGAAHAGNRDGRRDVSGDRTSTAAANRDGESSDQPWKGSVGGGEWGGRLGD